MAPSVADLAQTTTEQVTNGVAKLNLKETKPEKVEVRLVPSLIITSFTYLHMGRGRRIHFTIHTGT